MDLPLVVIAAGVGGFVAGVIALAVGGLGVLLQFRRQLSATADAIDEVAVRVEREVKRRAADVSIATRSTSSRQLGALAPVEEELSRADILRRHGG